jgi:hypothetical protein
MEVEWTDGDEEFSIVFGKGRHKDDLVYFQLDGAFLRQPDQLFHGGSIQVTKDEEVGRAIGYF